MLELLSTHKALKAPRFDCVNALCDEAHVSVPYLKPVLQLFNKETLKPEADYSEFTNTIKATVIS